MSHIDLQTTTGFLYESTYAQPNCSAVAHEYPDHTNPLFGVHDGGLLPMATTDDGLFLPATLLHWWREWWRPSPHSSTGSGGDGNGAGGGGAVQGSLSSGRKNGVCAADRQTRRGQLGVRRVLVRTQIRSKFGMVMGLDGPKNGSQSVWVAPLGRDFCPHGPKRRSADQIETFGSPCWSCPNFNLTIQFICSCLV